MLVRYFTYSKTLGTRQNVRSSRGSWYIGSQVWRGFQFTGNFILYRTSRLGTTGGVQNREDNSI